MMVAVLVQHTGTHH